MKKVLPLFFILASLAYGYNYNYVLLKAQASIFPKIMLLDKKLEEKLIDGKIVYTILYNENDYNTALDIRKFINENYKKRFDKYDYKVNLVEFSNFSQNTQTTAVYTLNSDKYIQEIAKIVKKKGIISFTYDISNLKNGLLLSLMLEKSTVIYINKENLYTKKVDFVESLFQIVKFLDTNNN